MICIYTDKYTNRLKFVADHIFKRILGQPINIINKEEDLPTLSASPLIVYSETLKVKGALHIVPNGLLFKKGVREYDITMGTWEGEKMFFATGGDIPFDIFSASFYLLSRYEEYLPIKENFDSRGCFISEKSLAYREGFLETPLVDVWALKLEEKLKTLFPNYTSSTDRRFRFLPIISVNTPYRYRTYSILGNVLRLGKKVIERDWSELKKQLRVLLRIDQDPYCNVERIVELHNRNSLRPLFAFRISNIRWYKRPIYFAYSTYKKVLCRNYQIGLCVSGVASNSATQLKLEQKLLSRIFRTRIVIGTSSLSEYVIPKFYSNIANSKIKEDFSMSYPDRIGFRASTCTPFRIYDLNKEEYYRVEVHSVPFTTWSLKKMKLSKDEIINSATGMAKVVKNLKGEFIIASHNDNFVDSSLLKGWSSTYEYVIRYISLLETTDADKVEKMNL
jgi:hypothetical protein